MGSGSAWCIIFRLPSMCILYVLDTSSLPVYLLITYIYALLTYGKLCNTHKILHILLNECTYMIIHVHKYMIYIIYSIQYKLRI